MAKAKELQELGEWKVGQKVTVHGGGAWSSLSIKPIDRITDGRKGTIYVDGNAYDLRGHQRGGDVWYCRRIKPVTDTDILFVRGSNAKTRLKKIDWQKIEDEKAIEIEKLLNENGIQTKPQ